MNKLIVKSAEETTPAVTPGKNFLNLFTDGGDVDFVGEPLSTLAIARTCRFRNTKGITLCIERDAAGDFSVTKIEEF